MEQAKMNFYFFFLEIVSSLILTDAQFLPYYPFSGYHQPAPSFLNPAVVSPGGFGRGHPGRPDEYGASLAGAPVAAYGTHHTWTPRVPYFAAPMPYFAPPAPFYPASYSYPYGTMFVVFPGNFMRGTIVNDDNLFRREATTYEPSESANVPKRMEISSRKLKGSFSSASATADSENEKTTADASSFQGKISEEVFRQIFNFRD